MADNRDQWAAAILVGGQGRRLGGCNKALLEEGGQSLLHYLLVSLEQVFPPSAIYLSTSRENAAAFAHLPHSIIEDAYPQCGGMGGMASVMEGLDFSKIFFVAGDMPLVSPQLIRGLMEWDSPIQAAVPRDDQGRWMTTCAAYSREILPVLQDLLSQNQYRLRTLIESIEVWEVGPDQWKKWDGDGRSFFNVNTGEDLEQFRTICRVQSPGEDGK